MIKLTTTNIKYLITINQIYNTEKGVRCTDVANILRVSKPSVHRMVETMKNMGLIDKDRYGEIFFTEIGEELAAKYSRYYEAFSRQFGQFIPEDADKVSGICAFLAEFTTESIEKMYNRLASV
ncbi:MAG: helix-turn-helix domain-containing protein [Clostridia bacterium]|nr:helix-turn-helix domain-containing protein [Clostridia bacterium]